MKPSLSLMKGCFTLTLKNDLQSSEVNFENGVVVESNFPNYETMRINQMPKIDVKIVASVEAPGGIGEPGTPIAAPALINALYAKTGRRITTLPISKSGFIFV